MNVEYDGQNAFTAAANGDFPLVVLLWGMAMAAQPAPVDMLTAADASGNTIMHHAAAVALEGNTSIVHFLIQQTQAAGRPLAGVVDARNHTGETPLIRAAHVGNLRVVETLIQFGFADHAARDQHGNTAAHHAAAQGHLWALHFLLEAANRKRPAPPTVPASHEVSVEGGRGKDKTTALHYATAGAHKVVVQYLMTRGFDANAPDDDGVSALDIARSHQLAWLVTLLETSDRTFSQAPTTCRETRLWLVLLYGTLLFGVLATSYWLPWYVSVPFIVVVLWKSLGKFRQPHGHGHSHGAKDPQSLHPSKRSMKVPGSVALGAPSLSMAPLTTKPSVCASSPKALLKPQPEMIVGVWMGWVLLFTFFHAVVWVDPTYQFVVDDFQPFLLAMWVAEFVFLAVWVRLAVLCPSDPGVVDSFQADVTDMLAKAAHGIPPPQPSHCRTCFIRKPVRSKHCAQCGVCVARMDHHCAWINRCVGFGNHRLFMCFLALHNLVLIGYVALAAIVFQQLVKPSNLEATRGSAAMRVWMQVPTLVTGHFLAFLVLVWALLAFVALMMMLVQHVGMMEKNLTINEQINWKRYPYLKQAAAPAGHSSKKPQLQNPFNRGLRTNVAEFWRRSGSSHVDYRTVFHAGPTGELPSDTQPLTTQEMV